MASTTKMMTAYIVCHWQRTIQNARRDDHLLRIGRQNPRLNADIRTGEKVKVGELLYGLLLPRVTTPRRRLRSILAVGWAPATVARNGGRHRPPYE